VLVLNGKDRGKKGKVLAVNPKEGKLIVEKVNFVFKHIKPKKSGQPGGIVKAEGAMYVSKVQLVCQKCLRQTRIARGFDKDGKKIRLCKKCGSTI
jgi:large subunit ribosomal protein L24